MTGWRALVAILGLAAITVATRGFFLFSDRELPMPAWLKEGLRYAPLAALAAVVAPEVLMDGDHLLTTWRDPRLFAVAAASAYYFARRGILGTIVIGTAVMVGWRVVLG